MSGCAAGFHIMPAAAYHADPCPEPSLSASIAHVLLSRSPYHAMWAHPKLNPAYQPKVDAKFDLGNAAHAYVLEGRDNVAVVHHKDWTKKEAQDLRALARAEGKTPLLHDQWLAVQAMAVRLRELCAAMTDRPVPFEDGRPEETLIWREANGIWCRARVDWMHTDERVLDDYKTTGGTANPELWTRTLFNLGFDIEAAFHLRGVRALGGPRDARFRFIVQEVDPPHAAVMVMLDPAALALAEQKVEYAIRLWGECVARNQWPGYPTEPWYAEAPPWEVARWGEKTWRAPVVDDGRDLGELL